MKTRIRSLTPFDLLQLQQIYEKLYPVSVNRFWLNVENAINEESPELELHKCTCQLIILIDREYISKALDKYEKSDKKLCWHKLPAQNLISIYDQHIESKIHYIDLLRYQKDPKVFDIARCYIPIESQTIINYSLWRLKFAIEMTKYKKLSLSEKRKNTRIRYSRFFNYLISKAKKNKKEYQLFLNFYNSEKITKEIWESIDNALNKFITAHNIENDSAYRRLSKTFTPSRGFHKKERHDLTKQYYQNILSSYQAYFETKELLQIIYNLVLIYNHKQFMQNPFLGKKYHNKPVYNKKGLWVKIIKSETKENKLKNILKQVYDNKLRNDTEGHNDYTVDIKNGQVICKSNGNKYPFKYIDEKIQNIRFLVDAILVTLDYRKLDNKDSIQMLALTGIRYIALGFDKKELPINGLTYYQFWSNVELDSKQSLVKSFNLALDPQTKFLILSFSNTFYIPGSMRFIPNKHTLEWLKEVYKKGEVHLRRLAIAPKMEFTLRYAKAETKIGECDFFILGESNKIVPIKKDHIKEIIDKLDNENLSADIEKEHTSRYWEELKKYE